MKKNKHSWLRVIGLSWTVIILNGQLIASESIATEITSLPFKVIKADMVQGGVLIGQLGQEESIAFLDKAIKVSEEGFFVIGFGREHGEELVLKHTVKNQTKSIELTIAARDWKIERVDGLPESKVNPTAPEVLQRIRADASAIKMARAIVSDTFFFLESFIKPAEGRISGVYGSQRVLNGVPKRPHYGLDIAAPVGTPIYAPASGSVSLVHNDMFYSGATVIIDHGFGLNSTFLHLDSIAVALGQKIKQGELIGTIGKSGRASGPHLDWRINWFDQRLDPALFIKL